MNLHKNIIKIWRVALYETKVIILSVKFLVLAAMSWMFMDLFAMPVRQLAMDYGLKLVPAERVLQYRLSFAGIFIQRYAIERQWAEADPAKERHWVLCGRADALHCYGKLGICG